MIESVSYGELEDLWKLVLRELNPSEWVFPAPGFIRPEEP